MERSRTGQSTSTLLGGSIFVIYFSQCCSLEHGAKWMRLEDESLGAGRRRPEPDADVRSVALARSTTGDLAFDVVSMAGAGAVVGLSYLAKPKGLTPAQALRNTMNFGVSDAIYSMLPINYKIFFKGGSLSDESHGNYWRKLPPVQYAEHPIRHESGAEAGNRLAAIGWLDNDPDRHEFLQSGDMRNTLSTFIEDIVDFRKLNWLCQPPLLFECLLHRYPRGRGVRGGQKLTFGIFVRHFRSRISMPRMKLMGAISTRARRSAA